jgi:hypothetical protein
MIFRVLFVPIVIPAPARIVAAGLVGGRKIVMLEVWR